MKRWPSKEVTAKEDALSGEKRSEAVKRMSRTATNRRKLLSVGKKFKGVDEGLFQVSVTDALLSVNEC